MLSLRGLQRFWSLLVIFVIVSANIIGVFAQQDATCGPLKPCEVGCCSKNGQCGFTEAHCGEGCQSNCNAKAECGQYAPEGQKDCPLNVCCSKHGFCGYTNEFCGSGCQPNSKGEGCGTPKRPSCPAEVAPLKLPRRVAYYQLFALNRDCGVKEPEDLPLGALTHLNLAFVNFEPNGTDKWRLDHTDSYWIKRAVATKLRYPHLRVNIAIGGWAFNDEPTQRYFSNMASRHNSRENFVKNVVNFLRQYGLDGVDIDWEYPAAFDRGGTPADEDNYVLLLSQMRQAFDREGAGWEISIAIPSSYWYLKGFALERLQRYVDYFNFMSYDIYGMWDRDNKWTGPYLKGHTDWSMIELGLDLLWRNGVEPKKVNMGFGFYGRSFTMENPSCFEPNGICKFSDGGNPGSCSNTKGVLTYEEIASRNHSLDVVTIYEGKETTVKYNVYGVNQWVSYDDAQSFHDKLEHLTSRCLGGLMIWAIDQDTSDFKAFGELMGDYAHLNLHGLDADSAEELSDLFGQYNGQHCYVTERCTKDRDLNSGDTVHEGEKCDPGYESVAKAHNPIQKYPRKLYDKCEKGWYRHICCPKKQLPKECKWIGAPERNRHGCIGECGGGTFELNSDDAVDPYGNQLCYQGRRKLCCRSTKLFDDCFWTKCSQTPYASDDHPDCPDGTEYVTWRNDKPDGSGGMCQEEYGTRGSPLKSPFRSSLCCPKGRSFQNCLWSNSIQPTRERNGTTIVEVATPEEICLPRMCPKNKIQVALALSPPPTKLHREWRGSGETCDSNFKIPKDTDPRFPLCCDPPSLWNKDWPVDPERLWEEYFNNKEKDKAVWSYDTQFEHNDMDKHRASLDVIDGSDAFGFLMLNGPQEAIDDSFHKTMTIVRRNAQIPKVKREIFTKNKTLIDKVFEHAAETFYAYCNYPAGSPECERLFLGGAEDTIISLPAHVGEGPFARVVSIQKVSEEDHKILIPRHHFEHRSKERLNDNPLWKIKIDYNFHLARQDRGKVKIRVDYSNLLGYWKEITDSPAERRRKRNFDPLPGEPGFKVEHFRKMVARGEEYDRIIGRRSQKTVKRTMSLKDSELEPNGHLSTSTVPLDFSYSKRSSHGKRWWGAFKEWLRKLTTVTKDELGDLPLSWSKSVNLFKASAGCPQRTWNANLRVDLNAEVSMQATYAYYMSATFIPPSKPDVFFYFGVEPTAALELVMVGSKRQSFPFMLALTVCWEDTDTSTISDAAARLRTGQKKIVDTLSYPGLAIKGIAAVGPTLDVYGEIKGEINLHGKALAGCRVTLEKTQVYWPQDDKEIDKYDKILGINLRDKEVPKGNKIEPSFEAGVELKAEVDVIVQPQANVGIKVGGGSYTGGTSLVDAEISAYVFTALQFLATGVASTVTKTFNYTYGVYLHWNVGYKAVASILDWVSWATQPREAYPKPRVIRIYQKHGSIDLSRPGGGFIDRRTLDSLTLHSTFKYSNETLAQATSPLDSALSMRRRQNDDDGDPMDIDSPASPTFSQTQLTCPAGGSPSIKIPELRLNCAALPPLSVSLPGNKKFRMSTVCDGYKSGNIQLPMTLTHASVISEDSMMRKKQRRNEACKNNDPEPDGLHRDRKSCKEMNEELYKAGFPRPVHSTVQVLECDEFPWAASEEGGSFMPVNERSRLCVPRVQNNYAGQCVDLLNDMQSNVGKMEPIDPPKGQERPNLWAYWGGKQNANVKIWYTTDVINGVQNRMTTYSTRQPIPVGYLPKTWKGNDKTSWVFKRNYTFSIVDDGSDAKSWWDATRYKVTKAGEQLADPNSYQSILCAVNIFGQTDYYKYPEKNGEKWNGLCLTSPRGRRQEWDDQWGLSRCLVEFGKSHDVKRSVGDEEATEWAVKNVTVLEEGREPVSPEEFWENIIRVRDVQLS